jgi:hypothetical protein
MTVPGILKRSGALHGSFPDEGDEAIETFLVLEHTGQMSREQVVGYFQRLFGGRLQRTHSHALNGLVSP